MRFTIISGSHRADSQSARVGDFLEKTLKEIDKNHTCYRFDLAGNPLPLWDPGVWSNEPAWKEKWGPVAKELQDSDAIILIAPEWGGMVPSGLKNFLLLCSPNEVGHKPGLIVGVSASMNGAYPISELRMSGYKNNRLSFIPEHLIVRNVAKNFDGEAQTDEDKYLRKRAVYALRVLEQYAIALKGVRGSGVIDHKSFANGM